MSAKHAIRGTLLNAAGVAAAGADASIVGPTLIEGLKRVVQEETLSPAAIETTAGGSRALREPGGAEVLVFEFRSTKCTSRERRPLRRSRFVTLSVGTTSR